MEPYRIKMPFTEASARIAATLRNVNFKSAVNLSQSGRPEVGDIILAQVTEVGDVKTLKNPHGREEDLHPGDLVLLAYGQRYAIAEYEALLPESLEECDLVSRGGVAGNVVHKNSKMGRTTRIQPKGFLCDGEGEKLNMQQFSIALEKSPTVEDKPVVIAFLGTGMDAGKTTTACATIKGLRQAGYIVGFGKVTGTGYSGDIFGPLDAGACAGYDFVDMGYPSTYMVPTAKLEEIVDDLINMLHREGCDTIVLEIADGIYQQDNVELLNSAHVKSRIDGVVLAADGPLGAIQANQVMVSKGYDVLAISGVASSAPLALREIRNHLEGKQPFFGCLTKEDLSTAGIADGLRKIAYNRSQGNNNKLETLRRTVSVGAIKAP